MPALNHVHTYVRFSKTQMKCDDPFCSHIQTKERLVGKVSRCAICKSTVFVLTAQDLKRAKPRCIECSQTKAARMYRENKVLINQAISSVLNPDMLTAVIEETNSTEEENLDGK